MNGFYNIHMDGWWMFIGWLVDGLMDVRDYMWIKRYLIRIRKSGKL